MRARAQERERGEGGMGEIGERGFCAFCARLFFAHSLFFGCANFLQAIVTAVFSLDRAFFFLRFYLVSCVLFVVLRRLLR